MFAKIVDLLIASACVTMALVVVAERTGSAPRAAVSATDMITVGASMPDIPGIHFSDTDRTLVIVTQSSCPYCEQSAAFWKRLASARKRERSSLRIVAVSADKLDTTREYFERHGIAVDGFASTLLPVRATPTLILVDSAGLVRRSWVGLPPTVKAEDEITRSVL